jgi:hypothetical protein
MLGAVVFPSADTGEPLAATGAARLFEFIVPGIAITAGAVLGAGPARAGVNDQPQHEIHPS